MMSYDVPYLGMARMDSWRVRGRAVCGPCKKRKIGGKIAVHGAEIEAGLVYRADGDVRVGCNGRISIE
jgi:hypothetical protein